MRGFLSLFVACLLALGIAFGASTLDAPGAEAARYSQVVDNSTKGRFAAPAGWGRSAYGSDRYGPNYRFAEPNAKGKPARYKVRIPSTARYNVFARWPSDKGYNNAAKYAILTSAGWKWKTVNQRVNGGKWVKLGSYKMKAGDKFSVRVARKTGGKGYVIADAIRVVRAATKPGGSNGGGSNGGGGKVTGAQVMREARTWLGVSYRYGGTNRNGVDCSGFTYAVYRKLGINLQRTAAAQYSSAPGKKVAKSQQRRGFLIFGNTGNQQGIQHVGILTGKKNTMIHAPYPGTVVRQETFGGWYNAIGVKRIVPPA